MWVGGCGGVWGGVGVGGGDGEVRVCVWGGVGWGGGGGARAQPLRNVCCAAVSSTACCKCRRRFSGHSHRLDRDAAASPWERPLNACVAASEREGSAGVPALAGFLGARRCNYVVQILDVHLSSR